MSPVLPLTGDGDGAGSQQFIPCAAFEGPRVGYAFRMGEQGLGYYRLPAAAPVQQVMEQHVDDSPAVDKEVVRRCGGPLPFGAAMAYAKAIPPEQRSVTGCYQIKCPGGCCIGWSYNVDCRQRCNCLWTPSCALPFVFLQLLGSKGQCFTADDDGGWYHSGGTGGYGIKKDVWIYEVDSETHTLACYNAGWGDWTSPSGPNAPCVYCVKL